jgi:DNA-binding MarR family transcriptional regulator
MSDIVPIRVPADFGREFPGASRSAAEVAANLVRTATAFDAEIERSGREIADLSTSAFQALAILEGADGPLTGAVIAERMTVSSASMTSLIDTLERRGLVERHRHPTDRRKVLIHLTGEARTIVDRSLPAVHATITAAVADLSENDRERLIIALTTIRARLDALERQPVPTAKPRRKRRSGPARRPKPR